MQSAVSLTCYIGSKVFIGQKQLIYNAHLRAKFGAVARFLFAGVADFDYLRTCKQSINHPVS